MDCERADSGATILPEAPPATPPHPPATPRIVPSPARVRRLPWPHERIDLSNPLPSPKDLGTSDNYTFLGKSYHLSSPPVATWDDCSYGWHGHSEEANLQQTTDPAVASGSGPPSTERPVPQSALDRTSSCSPASPTDRTDVGSLGSVISKLSLEEETESGVSPSTRLRHPFTGCGSGQDSPESGHKTERYTRVVHYHVSPRTCPSNNPGDAPRGNGAQNSRNSARRFRKTGADGTAGISQNHGGNAPDEESGDDSREHREKDRSGAGNNTNNRRAQPALDSPLACPFRKRNKERFNVRDHRQCTVPFKNFTYVKYVACSKRRGF
ncbi:hypothetical protein C8A03DRAFT_35608 [Achaetomium macrosporum]|uniref:Uncharacterized protein n=1 Tax=Achaetomium macrosporum TaxID=79813 RepID=A0AAN7C8U5_9PEZI|nr:hypothetical protein C8A03DRAFT_35608 [Achaetomium macrosporum]